MSRVNVPLTPGDGPAFPLANGMALRDYFAAHAMPPSRDVIASVQGLSDDEAVRCAEEFARAAYLIADAMLKERTKP